MKIVLELIGPDATDGTLAAIAASPDCCLSDGELAIRCEVVGVVYDEMPGAQDTEYLAKPLP